MARKAREEHWKGHAFAGYLHFSHRTGEKTARTVATPDGPLLVDYNTTGRAVGVEITPTSLPVERLNQLRADLGEPSLAELEYALLRAA